MFASVGRHWVRSATFCVSIASCCELDTLSISWFSNFIIGWLGCNEAGRQEKSTWVSECFRPFMALFWRARRPSFGDEPSFIVLLFVSLEKKLRYTMSSCSLSINKQTNTLIYCSLNVQKLLLGMWTYRRDDHLHYTLQWKEIQSLDKTSNNLNKCHCKPSLHKIHSKLCLQA